MLGYLDSWLGKPQETDLPTYDIDGVKGSTTNDILSTSEHGETLTRAKIIALRNATKIICASKEAVVSSSEYSPCQPRKKPCLFNIFEDPCECRNLYEREQFYEVRKNLENKINMYRKQRVKIKITYPDKRANPALHNGTWANWGDSLAS